MSQSTVIEPDGEPILVSLPDGTTLAIIVHAHVEEGEGSCPVVFDAERMLHRYADMLDDLNDVATSILMEASADGHTALQRSFINIGGASTMRFHEARRPVADKVGEK